MGAHLLKIIVLVILEIGVGLVIAKILSVPEIASTIMFGMITLNLTMYSLLFFVDPGTLFED